MARGRGRKMLNKSRKRKQSKFNLGGIDKKQRSHITQFGTLHPINERPSGRERYAKVKDLPDEEPESESSSSEEEGGETSGHMYGQLLTSLATNTKDDTESEEELSCESSTEDHKMEVEKTDSQVTLTESGDDTDDKETDDGQEDDYRRGSYLPVDLDETKDEELKTDPFTLHFEMALTEKEVESIGNSRSCQKEEIKISHLGRSCVSWPLKSHKVEANCKEKSLKKLHVKQSLCEQVAAVNTSLVKSQLVSPDVLTPLQRSLFSVVNTYQDLYFPERTYKNGEEIRLVYCLHALNHVLKTRSRVIAHNAKIAKFRSKRQEPTEEYRDQGLTRPKVLIVLPFRDSALRVVQMMGRLLMPDDHLYVTDKKRFLSEYGSEDDARKGFKPAFALYRLRQYLRRSLYRAKARIDEDYEAIFSGNLDDHFRVGLSIAKKSLKLYTEFYSSDIILASPLGLRTIIGAEGDNERDFDFLSSIEVLILDQADVFLMQNWDHVMHLMNHMHRTPKEAHGVDFSRVREWCLNGWSKYYRQTLIFSPVVSPEINAVFNKHCCSNVLVPKSHNTGTICQIVVQLPQVFQRIEASSYAELSEARWLFFRDKVLPQHRDSLMSHTLIFIPSYFDFVRMRNYFKKEEIDFVHMNEYAKDKAISRARNVFYHGKAAFMLYTERIHFYRRFKVRGIQHVVFYELPHYPHFYSEICNMIHDPKLPQNAQNFSCTVLYSKYDAQKLAAVVGTNRTTQMITSEKAVHMFVTGDS